ncbi:MAG: radical SAM protein [Firmicutes bacterium]|nr:radical SAM protein [Bacillota bacterium]
MIVDPAPRLVAWESTRACNLACVHCRAEAQERSLPGELSTEEAFRLVDQIAEFAEPIFIISGGEPLYRADIFEVASYATKKGFRAVLSTNGTLLTPEIIEKMHQAGIRRISVSLDGSSPGRNDSFRMVPGAFEGAARGLAFARDGNMPFQINTTVTRRNLDDLPDMLRTVIDLGAVTWDVFMLVPTGRGKIEDEVNPEEYEQVLNWIAGVSQTSPIPVKVTCGPHYQRITREKADQSRRTPGGVTDPAANGSPGEGQRIVVPTSRRGEETTTGQRYSTSSSLASIRPAGHPGNTVLAGGLRAGHPGGHTSRGCMAGNGFVFVSYKGEVFPCGYFPVMAGDVRREHFREIYQASPLFVQLRDLNQLQGKCGRCEYRAVCGGCRARALGKTGDYLAEEPYCVYQPRLGAAVGQA